MLTFILLSWGILQLTDFQQQTRKKNPAKRGFFQAKS